MKTDGTFRMCVCFRHVAAFVALVIASPLIGAETGVTFLVTSDSHYDAFENEDRNRRDRVTIDRMKEGKNQSEQQFRHFLADFGLDGTDGRLEYPVFEGCGNHDGPPVGRERFGFSFQSHVKKRNSRRLEKGLVDHVSENGLHYAWNWGGVHFVQLNLYPGNRPHPKIRYSPQYHDPQRSLDFLKADLAANAGAGGKPVVVTHHYDLQGTDWWHDEQRKTYYDAIRPYNVVAVFHGHTGTGVYRWKPEGEQLGRSTGSTTRGVAHATCRSRGEYSTRTPTANSSR